MQIKGIFLKITLLFLVLIFIFSCKKKEQPPKKISPVKIDSVILPEFKPILASEISQKELDTFYINNKRKELQQLLHDYWKSNKVNGSIIVAKNGKILLEEYLGYSNFETKDTLTANTGIHIASVSKVLTAMVVMKLIDVDSLKLNDDVKKFLPKFPYQGISVKNLLTHRSGLPNYAYFAADPIWDTNKILSNEEMLNLMVKHKPEAYNLPGKHFSYSNTNYALLALIIEKITGFTYAKAMKTILFNPLKMNNTFVFSMQDSAKVSQSYGFVKRKWDFNYLDAIYGDKNIYSTPRDLLKFDLAIYSDSFLSKAIKDSVFKGYSYEARGIKNYGLGFRLLEWGKDKELFYHNGWWHGNYSSYVHADKDTVSIIALGNKQNRSVYSAFNFISIFGDYPVELEGFPNAKPPITDSLNIDSLKIEESEVPFKNEKSEVFKLKLDSAQLDSLKQDSLILNEAPF